MKENINNKQKKKKLFNLVIDKSRCGDVDTEYYNHFKKLDENLDTNKTLELKLKEQYELLYKKAIKFNLEIEEVNRIIKKIQQNIISELDVEKAEEHKQNLKR